MNLETWNVLPDIWPKVITRAWLEPEFRTKLLSDHKDAFKDFDVELPQGLNLQVVEGDQPQSVQVTSAGPTLILRLPLKPQQFADGEVMEISDQLVSGGILASPW